MIFICPMRLLSAIPPLDQTRIDCNAREQPLEESSLLVQLLSNFHISRDMGAAGWIVVINSGFVEPGYSFELEIETAWANDKTRRHRVIADLDRKSIQHVAGEALKIEGNRVETDEYGNIVAIRLCVEEADPGGRPRFKQYTQVWAWLLKFTDRVQRQTIPHKVGHWVRVTTPSGALHGIWKDQPEVHSLNQDAWQAHRRFSDKDFI